MLTFQVLFLDIAMPEKMTRKQILQRYDDNYGLPTDEMVLQMKQACEKIENMKTYDDWFKVCYKTIIIMLHVQDHYNYATCTRPL